VSSVIGLGTPSETWAVISCPTLVVIFLVASVVLAAWIVEACIGNEASYADAVREVQRFVALTDRSRAELRGSPRLPLLDANGAAVTGAAVDRALELKHAARRELWPARRTAGLILTSDLNRAAQAEPVAGLQSVPTPESPATHHTRRSASRPDEASVRWLPDLAARISQVMLCAPG
jgi:hypothetical protein